MRFEILRNTDCVKALLVIVMVFSFLTVSCKSSENVQFGLELSQYLGKEKEKVLEEIEQREIPLDERSDPEERRYGTYIYQEEICGIPFFSELIFYQGDDWEEVKAAGIRRISEGYNEKKISSDDMNALYNLLLKRYGKVQESQDNVFSIHGTTYAAYRIENQEVKEKYETGRLFDLDIEYMQVTWETKDGGIVHLTYSQAHGIVIYEQSKEATEEVGYEWF